jgi:hypothetical protein
VRDDLDQDGRGLAYEDGFRDGLKDARMDLQARITVLESDALEIEQRTVEAIADYLISVATMTGNRCYTLAAEWARAGAWRPK